MISMVSCTVVHTYKFSGGVKCLKFSPDGKFFAASKDNMGKYKQINKKFIFLYKIKFFSICLHNTWRNNWRIQFIYFKTLLLLYLR